jgi:hypothetical protein
MEHNTMSELQTPGGENPLEQLFLRLLTYPGDPRVRKPALFVGKLPENFPIDIPVPENGRVLGTLVRSDDNIEIVLESDLTQNEVETFYRTQFTSQGWSQQEDFPHPHMGGFTHSHFGPHSQLIFCQGEQGASITLNSTPTASGITDIRLHVNLSREGNPCSQPQRRWRHRMHHGIDEMIPALIPPENAEQSGGGSGGSDREWHSDATLKTDMELVALAQHYATQLSRAGWVQTNEGTSAPLAWHTWKFTDEDQQPWNGFFFILKRPDKAQEHTLYIRVDLEETEGDSIRAGWTSSGGTIQRWT